MSLTFYLESHKYEGRYMYLSCIQTPDILTNTSKIDWTFVSTGGSAEYYATGPTVVKINGQQVFYAEMMGWTARKFPTAKGSVSGSLTIPHNDDGTKTIEVLLSTAIYTEEVKEQKATWELNKIDRFAVIKTAPNFNDDQDPTITYSNPAGTNISSLQACIMLENGTSITAFKNIPKTGSSYTFSLSDAEKNALRSATPNSNTLKVKFCIRSTIGSNTDESTLTTTMNIVNANPTLSPTVVDTNSKTSRVTGDDKILVALHSTADVKLNAVAKKSATIVSRKIEHGNQVLTNDGTLSVTNNPIRFTVVDSRGNKTTQDATNTIVPYFNPTCSIGNNLPEADGSFELEATGLFYNGAIGKTTNAITVQYRVKEGYGEYSQWVTIRTVTTNGNSYTATESLTGLDYQTSYTFQARVIDAINTDGIVSSEKKVIAEPVFDWGKNNFKFNVPVVLKDGCDILKGGTVPYAPAGYGFGGTPISVGTGLLSSEADLNAALEPIYSAMISGETKLVKFGGYPSNSDYNWFGLLSKASANYGSLVIHSAYDKGDLLVKAKYGGSWQPVKSFSPSNFAPAGYGYGGQPVTIGAGLLNDENALNSALEAVYSAMKSQETKLIRFAGYPSGSDYNWFGFLFKSSANYGSMVVHSAYDRGTLMTKTKVGGTWQPIEMAGVVQKKLWENASLTSNFAAQTISLDLSSYEAVLVETVRSTDDNTISGSTRVQVGGLPGYLMGMTDQFALTRRKVSATTAGVTFSGFYSANTTNGTSNEIPYRIYGIKGVSK